MQKKLLSIAICFLFAVYTNAVNAQSQKSFLIKGYIKGVDSGTINACTENNFDTGISAIMPKLTPTLLGDQAVPTPGTVTQICEMFTPANKPYFMVVVDCEKLKMEVVIRRIEKIFF